ncbi:MAG: hypothetical protein RMK31_07730 [Candidatus Caldarchaeum sp.]|nr:hypothetical protein [Candidatus Caldarchaeum sp.]
MVNVTFSLSEETVRRVKRFVRERLGSRRGAISGLVEEAVNEYLDRVESQASEQLFRAYLDGRVVAESDSLELLARRLREEGVDPRSVMIISSSVLRPVVRAGLRGRPS